MNLVSSQDVAGAFGEVASSTCSCPCRRTNASLAYGIIAGEFSASNPRYLEYRLRQIAERTGVALPEDRWRAITPEEKAMAEKMGARTRRVPIQRPVGRHPEVDARA